VKHRFVKVTQPFLALLQFIIRAKTGEQAICLLCNELKREKNVAADHLGTKNQKTRQISSAGTQKVPFWHI
jgi:hypothetical protein